MIVHHCKIASEGLSSLIALLKLVLRLCNTHLFFQLDTVEQLKNITQLKVYKYNYDNDYAKYAGLSKLDIADTGVIAQELSKVLPDAVRDTGDIILPSGNQLDNFQVVNKVVDSTWCRASRLKKSGE